MQLVDWQPEVLLAGAFGVLLVDGVIAAWRRSRAVRRFKAALDAYAEREMSVNRSSASRSGVLLNAITTE